MSDELLDEFSVQFTFLCSKMLTTQGNGIHIFGIAVNEFCPFSVKFGDNDNV